MNKNILNNHNRAIKTSKMFFKGFAMFVIYKIKVPERDGQQEQYNICLFF